MPEAFAAGLLMSRAEEALPARRGAFDMARVYNARVCSESGMGFQTSGGTMRFGLGLWVFGVLFCVGAGATTAASRGPDFEWNVFGADDRKEIVSKSYPWSTIGRVSTGCTGTLIARDLMLTAAHCAIDEKTHTLDKRFTYFYPNLIAGTSLTSSWMSTVTFGTKRPDLDRSKDWAIVRLKKPLGDAYGWMSVRNGTTELFNAAGYSGDFKKGQTAGVHSNCQVRKRTTGLMLYDCDTARGSSGGPLFIVEKGKPIIVGLNVAEYRQGDESQKLNAYSDETASVGIPASAFYEDLVKLLEATQEP